MPEHYTEINAKYITALGCCQPLVSDDVLKHLSIFHAVLNFSYK